MSTSIIQNAGAPVEKIVNILDEALDMLEDFRSSNPLDGSIEQAPDSLLEQCLALCKQNEVIRPEPIRTVHHFACTGGTLISKCLAAMPNTQVLSEIDPLSKLISDSGRDLLIPTDLVGLMRQSSRGTSDRLIVELFLNSIAFIYSETVQNGLRLVLRDHAHSHFCLGENIQNRPTLRMMVASKFPVVSVLTVRHPLDSYLSLKGLGWHQVLTLDEYCKRYLAFLEVYEGIPVIRYDDFVESPLFVMRELCRLLELPFSEDFINLFNVFKLSGDSGRGGNLIKKMPRRPIDAEVAKDIGESENYGKLLKLLDYN